MWMAVGKVVGKVVGLGEQFQMKLGLPRSPCNTSSVLIFTSQEQVSQTRRRIREEQGQLFSQVALTTTHNMCNSSHGDGFQNALSVDGRLG